MALVLVRCRARCVDTILIGIQNSAMLAASAKIPLWMLLTVQCVTCLSRNDPRVNGKTVTYFLIHLGASKLGQAAK